jgi:capsular polysaccharide transport system permease protein
LRASLEEIMAFVPIGDSVVTDQLRVVRALVLRDMRARFGAGFISYLVAIGIPLIHLLGLMVVPLFANQIAPIGTDYGLFAATGVLPYILCLYPARMMMLCLVDSGPLLSFPAVKPLDVIWARALLETAVAFTVTLCFLFFLVLADIEVLPHNAAEATAAILSTIYLGIGLGFVGAIVFKLFRAWMFVQLLIVIVMYLTSSAFILPRLLPEEVRDIIWFNPLFHCVEWMRLAYYEGYGEDLLSRSYLLGFSSVLFAVGMLSERLIRGRLMMAF